MAEAADASRRPARLVARVAILGETGDRGPGEDAARVLRPAPDETLCLLADGLGGHGAGEVAAAIAIETVARAVGRGPVRREALPGAIAAANRALTDARRRAPSLSGMRTTFALLHLDATSAWWLHCGDTRLYHLRRGAVLARTIDHSVAQMEGAGSVAPDRNALTRSLGGSEAEARPRVVAAAVALRSGDRFLLCTDGWWAALDEAALSRPAVAEAADPAAWAEAARDPRAPRASERDDATAIAVSIGRPGTGAD